MAMLLVPILPWMEGIRVRLRRFVAPMVVVLVTTPLVLPLAAAAPAGAQVVPGCTPAPAAASAAGAPIGGFNPLTPRRLLDTRPTAKVGAGCVVTVDVSSVAPEGATGIALNVTATEAAARGFVTAYPCGSARPPTSNVNPRVGDPTPNLVIVPLDDSRTVCLFTFAATNLVVDSTGWFGAGGALFHEQQPVRALDTRIILLPDSGDGKLPAGAERQIPLAGGIVPAQATAVAVNITVTEPVEAGYVTAYPCGTPPPLTSQVNFLAGENRANQAMVGLGTGGALCVYAFSTTHIIVDVAGWFGAADGGVPLQPVTGSRLVDSRDGTGGWNGSLAPGETRVLDPAVSGALPPGAHDVLLNVVATRALAPGFLTVYPCKQGQPPTSSVNYAPGNEATNLVTVPLDADGRLCVYSFERTDVVIDLLGSFGAPGQLRQFHVGGLVLDPLFRPDIHDYALHCTSATNPITFTATAMPGTTLTIDGVASGTDATGSKSLALNAALVVKVGTEEYWVRCLPPDFPMLKVVKTGSVAPGYYLMENGVAGGSGRFVMMLDTNGVPVWYRRVPASIDFKLLPDGNLAWMNFVRANFNINPAKRYEEWALGGTTPVRTIGAGLGLVTDYHDMIPLADGNFMVVSYSLRPNVADIPSSYPPCGTGDEVIDGLLQEVTPDGDAVWTWNSKDHTDLSESHPVCDVAAISGATATNAYDLLHINSVDEDPATGDLIVSARYMNAILRISRAPEGTVLEKIGGYTATNHDGATHFDVVGDPLGGFNLAHDARLVDGNHLTLFDNRPNATPPAITIPGKMRAVEYVLDRVAHTATFVWQRPIDGPCSNPACKSFGIGSVRRQPDGNTVIAWGGESSPAFTEVDADGKALLEVSLPVANLTYRVVKVPAAALDLAELHATAGME
jgi:Arylsulfotransferase (ASST)